MPKLLECHFQPRREQDEDAADFPERADDVVYLDYGATAYG
jgi:hypothetical protein